MGKYFYQLILAIILLSSTTLVKAEELFVGWELWYPYQYHSKTGELVGLDIEVFNAISKELAVTIKYTETPWKRHLQLVKSGQMDIAFGASFSKERESYAYFTTAYRKESVNLFVKKGMVDSIKLNKLSDLIDSTYMIGVEGGYFYGNDYQELIKNSKFQSHISEVIDLEENVNMLLRGHIDGFLVDPITMATFTQKYKMQGEFEVHHLPIYEDSIHIMLSRKTMTIENLKQFNQAIAKLKQNGTITQINKKWQEQLQ